MIALAVWGEVLVASIIASSEWLAAFASAIAPALGLVALGRGRWKVARLPAEVPELSAARAHALAVTSGVAAWFTAVLWLLPFAAALAFRYEFSEDRFAGRWLLVSLGLVWLNLCLGEFTFNNYVAALGEYLAPKHTGPFTRANRIMLYNVAGFTAATAIVAAVESLFPSIPILIGLMGVVAGAMAVVLLTAVSLRNLYMTRRVAALAARRADRAR